MRPYVILLLFTISIIACNNESPLIEPEPEMDSCEYYATGIFNDTLPGRIPQKYWPCMSTEVLVEAGTYNFPSLYMLMAGCCGLQSGYDLCRNKYAWFVELENREDALEYLIAKYESIDTVNYDMDLYPIEWGGYNFYTYNLEVFLAQKAYLSDATDEQCLELLNELLVKLDARNGEKGWGGIEGQIFVMSRVMFINEYQPLIDSINQNRTLKNLVELGFFLGDSLDNVKAKTTVFSLTSNYINELKNIE